MIIIMIVVGLNFSNSECIRLFLSTENVDLGAWFKKVKRDLFIKVGSGGPSLSEILIFHTSRKLSGDI